MGPGFDRKLGIFAALCSITCAVIMGGLAYRAGLRALSSELQIRAEASSGELAAGVSDELRRLADRARSYADSPRELDPSGELLGVSVVRRPAAGAGDGDGWEPQGRWLLPESSPLRLGGGELAELDIRYPVDYDRVARGESDVVFARADGKPAFVRLAFPYGPKSAEGYERAVVTEAKLTRLHSLFSPRSGLLSYLTSARGQLIVASEPGRFAQSEDLSQQELPRFARESRGEQGRLELAGERGVQYGAFARVGWSPGLTVFAQAPRDRVLERLKGLFYGLFAAGAVFALLTGLLTWRICRRWSWQLGVHAQPAQAAPPKDAGGGPPPGTADRRLEAVPKEGLHAEAAVLYAHLHDLDRLASGSEPADLLKLLDEFYQGAARAVEDRGGIANPLPGGSLVAFWGIPRSQPGDVASAIEAAAGISEVAHTLNGKLRKRGLQPCRLSMGLHHGAITAGRIGAEGRQEVALVGPAIEIASRIQHFTEQFGTDFILTAAAAGRAGSDYATEQLTAGDDVTPELFELSSAEEGAEAA